MTEDEALTNNCCGPAPCGRQRQPASWLQYAQGGRSYSPGDVAALEQYARSQAGRDCIGSACMAWRWLARPRVGTKQLLDASTGGYVNVQNVEEVGDGYCGLAGAPQ